MVQGAAEERPMSDTIRPLAGDAGFTDRDGPRFAACPAHYPLVIHLKARLALRDAAAGVASGACGGRGHPPGADLDRGAQS